MMMNMRRLAFNDPNGTERATALRTLEFRAPNIMLSSEYPEIAVESSQDMPMWELAV